MPCFTPVHSPESNGISEAFVKTFKRDYVRVNLCPTRTRRYGRSPGGSRTTTKTIQRQGSECAPQESSSEPKRNSRLSGQTGATPLVYVRRLEGLI